MDYSFKNFQLYDLEDKIKKLFESEDVANKINVIKGRNEQVCLELQKKSTVIAIRTSEIPSIELDINYIDEIEAPVQYGNKVGYIIAKIDDNIIFSQDILVKENIERKTLWDYLIEILTQFVKYCYEL